MQLYVKECVLVKIQLLSKSSVVTKDIPPNVVAAGNPAKIVKNLTDQDFISEKTFMQILKNLLMTLIC